MKVTEARDAIASMGTRSTYPIGEVSFHPDKIVLGTDNEPERKIELAWDQTTTASFASFLGVPVKYAMKCPPYLRSVNFQEWRNTLSSADKVLDVTIAEGVAVDVADSFAKRIHGKDLAQAVVTALGDDMDIREWFSESAYFYVEAFNPSTSAVGPDDVISGVRVQWDGKGAPRIDLLACLQDDYRSGISFPQEKISTRNQSSQRTLERVQDQIKETIHRMTDVESGMRDGFSSEEGQFSLREVHSRATDGGMSARAVRDLMGRFEGIDEPGEVAITSRQLFDAFGGTCAELASANGPRILLQELGAKMLFPRLDTAHRCSSCFHRVESIQVSIEV